MVIPPLMGIYGGGWAREFDLSNTLVLKTHFAINLMKTLHFFILFSGIYDAYCNRQKVGLWDFD